MGVTKVVNFQNQPLKQFVMQLKKINITNLKLNPRYQLTNIIDQYEPGASQDWSKWSHWNHATYWYSTTQYDDPVWGKVFYGRGKRDVGGNTYIYNYSPNIPVNVGVTYILSFYIKTSTDLTLSFLAYLTPDYSNTVVATDTRTYSLRANEWTKVEMSLTPNTSSNVQYGVRFTNVPDGQEFWIAYPQIVKEEHYEQIPTPLQQIKNNIDGISVNTNFHIDPLSNEYTQEQYVFFKLFNTNNSKIINDMYNANVWSLDKVTITKDNPITQITYLDIYQVPDEAVYAQPYVVLNTKLNNSIIKCSQKQTIVLDRQQLRT